MHTYYIDILYHADMLNVTYIIWLIYTYIYIYRNITNISLHIEQYRLLDFQILGGRPGPRGRDKHTIILSIQQYVYTYIYIYMYTYIYILLALVLVFIPLVLLSLLSLLVLVYVWWYIYICIYIYIYICIYIERERDRERDWHYYFSLAGSAACVEGKRQPYTHNNNDSWW